MLERLLSSAEQLVIVMTGACFALWHPSLEKVDGGGGHDSVGVADELVLSCDDVVLVDCAS